MSPHLPPRPRLAVFKFASCDGCQVQVLDVLGRLPELAARFSIDHFLEASSRSLAGPYDVGLVEGSISTPADAARIRAVREACRFLVTIGACATAGGIQALRNWARLEDCLAAVYARPAYVATLATSTPIATHVPVDFELRGCPIDAGQLGAVLTALVVGRRPGVPPHCVCVECKARGAVCVAVARGLPCLGPVTQAGCGAICPAHDRECFGCFGPGGQPQLVALTGFYERRGTPRDRLLRLTRSFTPWADEFRQESDRLAGRDPAPPAEPPAADAVRRR